MENSPFSRLSNVLDRLIGSDGCSWDKEQSPESLADYVIEESHELVEAIRSGRIKDICSELGDVAFLLLFISRLYENKNMFTLEDALNHNADKMIRRHPHVFASTKFTSREEQLKAWEAIKREETAEEDKPGGTFHSLPKGLPPLIKAYRIHSKSARVGFTWPDDTEVEQQVEAEWLELIDALQGQDKEAQSHELGDILFTLVELGRRKGIKANDALDYTNMRFVNRFNEMEKLADKRGLDFVKMTLDEKDTLWNEVKALEHSQKTTVNAGK